MLVAFLIDTSASMNARAGVGGMTLLDCAKSAVEHFLKVRGRDTTSRSDRYFLITTEDGPTAVKATRIPRLSLFFPPQTLPNGLHFPFDINPQAGWKDTFMTFINEVKNLVSKDLTNLGNSLRLTFDLLNQFRPIDNYG